MLRFMDLRWPRVFRRFNVGRVNGLTLIPVWINNHIHYIIWDEIVCTNID